MTKHNIACSMHIKSKTTYYLQLFTHCLKTVEIVLP